MTGVQTRAHETADSFGFVEVGEAARIRQTIDHFLTFTHPFKALQRAWVVERISRDVAPGGTVLEIGGGDLSVAALLTSRGYQVTVIDPFDGRNNGPILPTWSTKQVEHVVLGLFPEDLPTSMRFDAIASVSVLEHLGATLQTVSDAMPYFLRNASSRLVHAVDVVLAGEGEEFHAELTLHLAKYAGVPVDVASQLFHQANRDPSVFLISPLEHEDWRGALPYEEFPMRRVACLGLDYSPSALRIVEA